MTLEFILLSALIPLVAVVIIFLVYSKRQQAAQEEINQLKNQMQELESSNRAIEVEKERMIVQLESASKEVEYWKSAHREEELAKERESVIRIEEREKLQKLLADKETEFQLLESTNRQLSERLEQQKEELTALQKQFKHEFESLANQILETKSKKFTEQNKEQLAHLLLPLGEQLKTFKEQVESTYKTENEQRISLQKEVNMLINQTKTVSEQAEKLAEALKSDKKLQGNWGEMILERILEHAGLEEGREFDRQPTYKTEQGQKFIPDVVIHYPDGRKMVVDSKVSLVAYYDWVHEEHEDKKAEHLKRHIAAIKNHIDGLSGKGYEKVVEGLDFVMLFMPLEPAYLAALQGDDQLWAYAYHKMIMLTGPSNLLISVKIVQDLWKRYDQSRNAFKIAEEAGKMLDKFIAFTQDMEKLGDRLRQSQESYDLAMNKLTTGRGDLIGRIEKVHKLGASSKKSLDEIPAKILKAE